MPRSGPQGTATPPPGLIPKNPGDVIPSGGWNGGFADIYDILNTPQPGTYGGTGASTLAGGYDNLSVKASDLPSAATTDIGASAGRLVHITGTTTITSLGSKTAGVEREVVFDGSLTLTHNATSLILPGATNITTAPGDTAVFVSEGSGNWRCVSYQRGASIPDPVIFTSLVADRAGADTGDPQAVFSSGSDELTVEADTTYFFEALYMFRRAAGTNSHEVAMLFGGTATLSSIGYVAQASNPSSSALSTVTEFEGATADSNYVTQTNSSATEQVRITARGIVRVNAGGSLIPQIRYSVAPGGAPTFRRNSFFRLEKAGSGSIVSKGAWS